MTDHIAEAPQELIDLIFASSPKRRERTGQEPPKNLDSDGALARAKAFAIAADPAREGEGGDHHTYRTACRMRDFGVSAATAYDLLVEHFNPRCEPPWGLEDLEDKVLNAFAYATGQQGGMSAENDFEVETDEAAPAKERPKIYRVTFNEAADTALERIGDPLVEGLIDQEAMMVLYGDSNSGKTFLMLDIAFHIAAGRPWCGRDVAQGLVVYVAAEGGRGIFKRVKALRQHYGRGSVPLDIVPCPVNLLSSKADIAAVVELVREAERQHGCQARLVVVDTLSRAIAGGDENTSTDMGAFVKNADKIRAAIKATLAIVHHSGKDTTKGARGWSGLRAATDTEIEIVDGVIRTRKQRDMEFAEDVKFVLEQVDVGRDHKDRPVTSAVIKVVSGSDFMEVELDPRAQEMMDAFENVAKDKAIGKGEPLANWVGEIVEREEWEQEYLSARKERFDRGETQLVGGSGYRPVAEVSARYMSKLRNLIAESGHVKKIATNQWVKS